MTTMIAADEGRAEYGHYRVCCTLVDRDATVVASLPLGAWAQLCAWHRDVNSRPLMFRDIFGQTVRVDRSLIAKVERRDLDSVVAIERKQNEWSDE